MWFKYLIVPLHDDNLHIGVKFEDRRLECIVGGQKRYIEYMLKNVILDYFGVEEKDVVVNFPQTYKVRLKFKCTGEMIKEAKRRFRDQTELVLLEVDRLDRTLR